MSFESVRAGDESQAAGGDAVNVGLRKSGSGLSRGLVEEAVHEPESAGVEDVGQLSQIIRFVLNSMKAAEVEGEVECPFYIFHCCCIVRENIGLYVCFADFLFCHFYGDDGKIETGNLPARVCHGDDICAGAAADIQRAAWLMVPEKIVKFGGGDAAIPGR